MHVLLEKYFSVIKKVLPDDSLGTSVGLDISSGECKLIELNQTTNGVELLTWYVEPIEGENVSGAIKKALDHLNQPCQSLYTSIFGKGTLIRYIELPRMSDKDLKTSFAIESEKYFPFSQDQIYTDCFILDPEGKGSKMSVMAAAVRRELVDERIKIISELGYDADFIGVNPVAIANVLNILGSGDKTEKTCCALLDMGESVSSLTIFINNVPRFTREIFVGGSELTKRISNALGVSLEKAEQLKKKPEDKQEEINAVCESAVMDIVQELRLSFDYFSSEKNQDITKLLLTGGASMLKNMNEMFEKNLSVEVMNWDPLGSIELSPSIDRDQMFKSSLKMGVALGLALYHYDRN